MSMIKKKRADNAPPKWLVDAAQGLAYWVAYRRTLFSRHSIPEGALATELTNLVARFQPDTTVLFNEFYYEHLIPKGSPRPPEVGGDQRADLVICTKTSGVDIKWDKNISESLLATIEIKRAYTGSELSRVSEQAFIDDLKRLKALLDTNEKRRLRTFLLVVSESRRPSTFVTDDGNGRRKWSNSFEKRLKEADLVDHVGVMRVLKASASLRPNNRTASYVCILEVKPSSSRTGARGRR